MSPKYLAAPQHQGAQTCVVLQSMRGSLHRVAGDRVVTHVQRFQRTVLQHLWKDTEEHIEKEKKEGLKLKVGTREAGQGLTSRD